MKCQFPEKMDGSPDSYLRDTPAQKRLYKRIYRRRFRRWGKRLLDNAPRKYYYKGYTT